MNYEKFHKWKEENKQLCQGKNCVEATIKLKQDFPELERVCGYFECLDSTKHTHWWCFENNLIYDPTVEQFREYGGAYEYHPFNEQPVGKCHNCGELMFSLSAFCSDECALEWRVFDMSGLKL